MLRKVKSVIIKEIFFSLLSAVLLILSFPNFGLSFFAWVAFVPLFFALQNKSKVKAFLLSYICGVMFWLGAIYWLAHVTLPGMIILILYLALYFAIFGLIISRFRLPTTSYPLLFVPSLWVLLEYLRSHLFTGFGWALLGYSQYLNLPIIQIADITGTYGVSFLVMMTNVWIYRVARSGWREAVKKQKIIFPSFILLLSLTYGFYKLTRTPHLAPRTPFKISVIQGNIPQELKWDPLSKDFIIDRYLTLTSQALIKRPDLIIWPEAALPVVLEEEPLYYEKVKDFIQKNKIPLLFGAVTQSDNFYPHTQESPAFQSGDEVGYKKSSSKKPRSSERGVGVYYNSALLISSEGKLLRQYDKLHLVPFGEYIPLRRLLGFLETIVPIGDFTAGKEYTVFKLPVTSYQLPVTNYQLPLTFSVLICFEDLFPELSREFRKKDVDFLVNITNDAWFKRTSSPYQHLQASVFRAIENRIFLVRAANTGVSGFIAPSGKIISLVQDKKGQNLFISGYKTEEITISRENLTFYTRYGDVFILLCFIFSLSCLILSS